MADMRKAQRAATGIHNGGVKLTEEQALAIYHSPLSQTALAKVYGISQVQVGRIKLQQSWAYLKLPELHSKPRHPG
jgi:hypothetical protein